MTNAKYVPEAGPPWFRESSQTNPRRWWLLSRTLSMPLGPSLDDRPSEILPIRRFNAHDQQPGDRDRIPAFLYVYVRDTDLSYQRALSSGATSI